MTRKLLVGETNTIWSLTLGSRQLQEDYPYVNELESYGRYANNMRSPDVADELRYNIPWDCHTGFILVGNEENLRKVLDRLLGLMKAYVDEEDFSGDLLQNSMPTVLSFYEIPTTGYYAIIGSGYYEEQTPEVEHIIYHTTDVYGCEAGANYDDLDPFESFLEQANDDPDFPLNLCPVVSYLSDQLGREEDEE